ncbi:MAG: DUF4440 domain-containing protein [Bradymonadaceae bacterium]
MTRDTLDRCRREIHETHDFFEAWFSGNCPETEEKFARLESALGAGFAMVIPEGRILERSELLQSIRQRHGFRVGTDFSIRIDDVDVRVEREDVIVATYEEWQHMQGRQNGRISSVVFGREPDAPNGLRWQHLHESWLKTPDLADSPERSDP